MKWKTEETLMKRIKLVWYGPFNVANLSEVLRKSVLASSNEKYHALNDYGFYMYYDKNIPKPPKYIGQSYGKSARTLGKRIRWEIIKDGLDDGAVSKFTEKCQKYQVFKLSLSLKVSHIKEPPAEEHSPKLMNNIEMALIHEMQPIMNDHGKKRYRRGSIEIFNYGDSFPLPAVIRK